MESTVKDNFKLLGLSDLKNGVTFDKHSKASGITLKGKKKKERGGEEDKRTKSQRLSL